MCKDPEVGEGAWCGEDWESPGRDGFYVLRGHIRRVVCLSPHLPDGPGREGPCSVLQAGNRGPQPLRGPGPEAVGLVGLLPTGALR